MGCHEKFLLEHKESSAPARRLLGFYLFLIFPLFLNSFCILFMFLSGQAQGVLGPCRKQGFLFFFKEKRGSDTQRGGTKLKEKQEKAGMRNEVWTEPH